MFEALVLLLGAVPALAGQAQSAHPGSGLDTARIEKLTGAKGAFDVTKSQRRAVAESVVFVCEHGSVKSLIAQQWFNRLAHERGLVLRAVSRGVTPEASVPPAIADALRRDGFDVTGFAPRSLDATDAAGAARIVTIGVDPGALPLPAGAPVERWDGIPAATAQYEAARDALKSRIQALIGTLEAQGRE